MAPIIQLAALRANELMPLKHDAKYSHHPAVHEYFIPFGTADFYSGLEAAVLKTAPALQATAEAFLANLRSVEATVSMPFHMAATAVQGTRFQLILASERIRALKDHDQDNLTDIALPIAQKRFNEEVLSAEHREVFINQILAELSQTLRNGEMHTAAQELLRTSLVLIWGAIEVLISDSCEVTVNCKAELYEVLLKNEKLKRRMNLKTPTFEDLKRYSFNVGDRLGSLILESNNLDSVGAIRDLFDALEPNNAPLQNLLRSDKFWLMWQQRNAIVHRRAVVDRQYLESTADRSSKLGERLNIRPEDIQKCFELARDLGINVIIAFSRQLTSNV